MDLPAGVTVEHIIQWDYRMKYDPDVPAWCKWPGSFLVDVLRAAYWLEFTLQAKGAGSATMSICNEFCKKCVAHFDPDPWMLAELTVKQWEDDALTPFPNDYKSLMVVKVNALRIFVGYIVFIVRYRVH